MTITLDLKVVVTILGLAIILASGLVYAAVIQRDVPGSFVIG